MPRLINSETFGKQPLTLMPKFINRVVPPDQNFDHDYCGVFREELSKVKVVLNLSNVFISVNEGGTLFTGGHFLRKYGSLPTEMRTSLAASMPNNFRIMLPLILAMILFLIIA